MIRSRMQNSTGRPITFLLVSSTDHVAPQTGKSPTVTLSKDGGSFAAASGSVSEIGNGLYALAGNATDRNTLGELVIRATATGCDDVLIACVIVATDPFDSNFGLANLDAAISSRLASGSYTAPPDSGTIAAAVLTKRVEDVIAGLGSSDDHTLAFVIELFTEAARIAGAIRVRKPDGTTWKDKTITENATQNPVESIT